MPESDNIRPLWSKMVPIPNRSSSCPSCHAPLPPDSDECPICTRELNTPPSTWVLLRLWRFAKPYQWPLLAGFLLLPLWGLQTSVSVLMAVAVAVFAVLVMMAFETSMFTTRAASESHLGEEVAVQMLARTRPMAVAATMLVGLALVPGLPKVSFLLVAALLGVGVPGGSQVGFASLVDLRTGDIAHSLTIEGIVRELYDVAVLPGVAMPSALGFKTEEIRRTITIEEARKPDPACPSRRNWAHSPADWISTPMTSPRCPPRSASPAPAAQRRRRWPWSTASRPSPSRARARRRTTSTWRPRWSTARR